jgi:hypothetical protein
MMHDQHWRITPDGQRPRAVDVHANAVTDALLVCAMTRSLAQVSGYPAQVHISGFAVSAAKVQIVPPSGEPGSTREWTWGAVALGTGSPTSADCTVSTTIGKIMVFGRGMVTALITTRLLGLADTAESDIVSLRGVGNLVTQTGTVWKPWAA